MPDKYELYDQAVDLVAAGRDVARGGWLGRHARSISLDIENSARYT